MKIFPPETEVYICFPSDPGLENGYIGFGTVVKYDNSEIWTAEGGQPYYEVKMPNNIFTAYFPQKYVMEVVDGKIIPNL